MKPQSVTVQNLDSISYCYVYSLSLTAFLIPPIATTHVHPPTWASSVSVPEYLTATRGHLPTWVFLVSAPAYRLPTQTSFPFWLQSYCITISPPLLLLLLASSKSSRVALSYFPSTLGATTHSSSVPLLHTLSPLHLSQIRDVAPPTAPRLHAVSLCKS